MQNCLLRGKKYFSKSNCAFVFIIFIFSLRNISTIKISILPKSSFVCTKKKERISICYCYIYLYVMYDCVVFFMVAHKILWPMDSTSKRTEMVHHFFPILSSPLTQIFMYWDLKSFAVSFQKFSDCRCPRKRKMVF